MTRKFGVFLAVLAALALTVSSVFAVAAKFHAANGSINNSGALVVTWDERGVGEGDITYSLTADATALWACFNRGGHNPAAQNKRSVEGDVATGGTFESKNGRVQGSLTAGPLSPGDFTCPGGQVMRLASVSYSNIVLTDTTNDSSVTIPDVSRTFIAV